MDDLLLALEQGLVRPAPRHVRQARQRQGLAGTFTGSDCPAGSEYGVSLGACVERQREHRLFPSARRREATEKGEDRQRRQLAVIQPASVEQAVRSVASAREAASATSAPCRLQQFSPRQDERPRRASAQPAITSFAPVRASVNPHAATLRLVKSSSPPTRKAIPSSACCFSLCSSACTGPPHLSLLYFGTHSPLLVCILACLSSEQIMTFLVARAMTVIE